MNETKKTGIDFSSKDFEATQRLLGDTARLSSLKHDSEEIKQKKEEVLNASIKDTDSSDVIQSHIDKYTTPEELERYLAGDLSNERTRNKIDEFFTDDETGEVLEMADNKEITNVNQEYEFKRGLLLYFKQNDYYLAKIDEEVESLNKATAELNSDLSEALNPLKDDILAYSEYLLQESEIKEGDTPEEQQSKKYRARKAIAIRSGYSLENMIALVKEHPGIIKNALKDFRSDDAIRKIGQRYTSKLKNAKINFNLFSLLSDDVKDSLEYRTIPQGDYPEGLEGFTVFFIIRAMSIGFNNIDDIYFHASAQIALSKFIEGDLDPELNDYVRDHVIEFLSYFKED